MSQGTQSGALQQPREEGGWREFQEGGDRGRLMADSCCYLAETNITL